MDQMHSKFKSPSISLRLPTDVGVYVVRERDCPTVRYKKMQPISEAALRTPMLRTSRQAPYARMI